MDPFFSTAGRGSSEGVVDPGGLRGVSDASLFDTMRVMSQVVLPTFGKGVIMRRRGMEHMSERFDLDKRAVRLMQDLARRHRRRSILLKIPAKPLLLVLNPQDVAHVLDNSPEPYATATNEKRAALNHLEPGNVLISNPAKRAERRPYHEQALATTMRCHPMGERFLHVITEEMEDVLAGLAQEGVDQLGWDSFSNGWFRIVRRIVLGDAARNDEGLTETLNRLRGRANWAFFEPKNRTLLTDFRARLKQYVDRAEAGSLLACAPRDRAMEPESQIPQWLFAFDPAGMTTFRCLALLALHPDYAEHVRQEATMGAGGRRFTRTCILETLRLWPTTPAILRELASDVEVGGRTLKKGTGILIFTPFFNRDDTLLPFAHHLHPQIWDDDDSLPAKGIVPFSSGPAVCPAHNLVPFLVSLTLGFLLSRVSLELVAPVLDPRALPGTLNHFGIRLKIASLGPYPRA